jgi:hypothetical protein
VAAVPAVSSAFRHPDPPGAFDVRCSASLPRRPGPEGRCQLFAGHDGPHAVMYGRHGERLVRTWRTGIAPSDTRAMQRPWMFGFPVPAWFEADPAPELAT